MSVIFRRIYGRIVPIRIASEKLAHAFNPVTGQVGKGGRIIKATYPGPRNMTITPATMHITVPKQGAHATVDYVQTSKMFRQKGLAGALFEHALKLVGRAGKKTLRSDLIEHPAQVAIRNRFNTKFWLEDGPRTKITAQAAKKLTKAYQAGHSGGVKATTLVPKKYWTKKGS